MAKLNSIEDVANRLGDRGPFASDIKFKDCGEVIDALVNLGNSDKVHAFHDDHLGLENDLSQNFLDASVEEVNNEKFESDVELVLEQAERIFELNDRELSEEQIDDVREDFISRGLDPDDPDF